MKKTDELEKHILNYKSENCRIDALDISCLSYDFPNGIKLDKYLGMAIVILTA